MTNNSSAPPGAPQGRLPLPVWGLLAAALAALVLCIGLGGFGGRGAPAAGSLPETPPPAASSLPSEPGPTPEPEPVVATVDFSATGDNLIHSKIYQQAAARAVGDAAYSFDYCYEALVPFYRGFDVNWINQETLCTDELAPSTYPSFSTPGDCARALYRAGIRVFSLSNNHTYDKGSKGIAATLRFWDLMRRTWSPQACGGARRITTPSPSRRSTGSPLPIFPTPSTPMASPAATGWRPTSSTPARPP